MLGRRTRSDYTVILTVDFMRRKLDLSDSKKQDLTRDRSREMAPDPFALVRKIKSRGPAPVHLWNPPFCGDIDMLIRKDGSWLHEGKPIRRKAMLQLFASILLLDSDGQYYLVTPVEKVRIRVEDCPFVILLLEVKGRGREQQLLMTTNTDEVITVDAQHPLRVTEDPASGEPHPTVHVRSDLNALISRNVFYQLVELAELREQDGVTVSGVWSGGSFFVLGAIDDSIR